MLPRADLTGTQPLARIEALAPTTPAGDARQEAFNRLALIAIGKQLQAQVLSRLNDGTFLVRIAGAPARMSLPAGANIGDVLDLTLVATTPRPTFLLGQPPRAAVASLSAAGRFIGNLLQSTQQEGAPASLVGKAPLLTSPAAGPSQVAVALQSALAFSGLFYESHVSQWAQGGRALADLMQEPQAQPGKLPQTETSCVDLARPIANTRASADAGRPWADPMRGMPLPARTTGPADADGLAQLTAMGSEAAHMINMQLDALERRHVLWQGELWPGQPLEWDVSDETPESEDETGTQAWQSVVRFELPTLGAVTATIRLADGHVQVKVRTSTEPAASLLRTHGSLLAGALEAAGSPLDLLTVRQDEPL